MVLAIGKCRVCLVTSGNLASNPRLVKEASALVDEGYSVRIVAADILPSLTVFDEGIVDRLGVDVLKVSWHVIRPLRLLRSMRRAAARFVASVLYKVPLWIAVRAHHVLTPKLTEVASRQSADVYIAHNLAALSAAANAATKHKAKLGFDAEDFHCGEVDTCANPLELKIRRTIEATLLPECHHLTSASPHISDAYASDFHVKMTPILNVFPLAEAAAGPVQPASTQGELLTLYWFSQTIGRSRGLEQMISAIAKMRAPVRLLLRGNPATNYLKHIQRFAAMEGGSDLLERIEFLPVAAPSEMVRLAARYDLGLAIEPGCNRNNEIALSNKAFTYLLAGVPVLLSRTIAQSELAKELGLAAVLVDINQPQEVAKTLDDYFLDPDRQRRARAHAWKLGRERYNWDIEKLKFLDSVERCLIE